MTVFVVPHSDHKRIHGVSRVDDSEIEAIFMLHLFSIGPCVGHNDLNPPALKFAHHVYHFAVTDVGAVLLESEASAPTRQRGTSMPFCGISFMVLRAT